MPAGDSGIAEGVTRLTFDATEKSVSDSKPFELYLFQGVGINIAVTSADKTINYSSNIFPPTTIDRTEVDVSSEVTNGQIKVYLPKNHAIAQLFVGYLPTSPVALSIFAGHDGDPDVFCIFIGYVASVNFGDQAELVCNAAVYKLQTRIPRVLYQSQCPHIFGSPQCGVNLIDFTFLGVVGAISADGTQITVTAFGSTSHTLKNGFFRRGNDLRMIVDHTTDVVTLLTAIADLQVGDAILGVAGCAQTFDDCNSYNNIANFLGFDLIPILNPFDGTLT
jgi:hypothetical protein